MIPRLAVCVDLSVALLGIMTVIPSFVCCTLITGADVSQKCPVAPVSATMTLCLLVSGGGTNCV